MTTTQPALFTLADAVTAGAHHAQRRASANAGAAAKPCIVQLEMLAATQDGQVQVNRSITSLRRRRGEATTPLPNPGRLTVPEVRAPQSGQRFCSANPKLYLDVLSDPPTDARDAAAYGQALELGRKACVTQCAFWVECLTSALEGPRVDGFVAGTTSAERDALRDALHMTSRVVHVEDYAPPVKNQPGAHLNHDRVWIANDRFPGLTRKELADKLNCSEATVKRVLCAPRPRPKDPVAAVEAYRAPRPNATAAQVAAATVLPVSVVEQIDRQVRDGVSEYALRDAYEAAVFCG